MDKMSNKSFNKNKNLLDVNVNMKITIKVVKYILWIQVYIVYI